MQFSDYKAFVKTLASFSIMAAVGLGMLTLSWKKWPDILVDFGTELYVAWQISSGRVLYLDIAYFFPPLSPYWNSLLFTIFGTNLMTLAGFNLLLVAALAYLIYRIFLAMSDRTVATAAATVFLGIFAFSQYVGVGNYNFVTPYIHDVTHGIVLSFFCIWAFLGLLAGGRPLWLGAVGISLGLIFLTKLEVFLAISLAMGTGLLMVIFFDRLPLATCLRGLGILSLGFLLPVTGFIGYFSGHMSFANALASITQQYRILSWTPMASNTFYLTIMGMDAPLLNLTRLLLSSLWYGLALLLLLLAAYVPGKISSKNLRTALTGGILLVFILAVSFFRLPWLEIFRPLPLFMLGLIIYSGKALWSFRKDRPNADRWLPVLVFSVFSFALLFKMILNTHVYHYGFALALPATLATVMILLYHVPHFLERKFGRVAFVRLLGIAMVGMLLVSHIIISKNIYDLKTYAVGSNYDTILTWKPEVTTKGVIVRQALEKIREVVRPDENFVVFPEGVMLNYLARRVSPSPHLNFIPTAVIMSGEDRILTALQKNPPNYVVLVQRDTLEFGYHGFGIDYALKIFSWIKENYDPLYLFGNHPLTGKGFGIIIAKRVSQNNPR